MPKMCNCFEDKRRLSQICPEMCFKTCHDSKALIKFLIWLHKLMKTLTFALKDAILLQLFVQKRIKNLILAPVSSEQWIRCSAIHHCAAHNMHHTTVKLLSQTAGVWLLVK